MARLSLWVALAAVAGAAFVRPPAHEQSFNLQLVMADRLGLGYAGIAHNSSSAQLKNFALSLDAKFQPLNSSGFDALRAAYSGWSKSKPSVAFDAEGNYTLLDFLPPIMQAVSGFHFHTQRHTYSLPSFIAGAEARQSNQASP